MSPFATMLFATTGAAACIPVGALLARIPSLHPGWLESEIRHFVMAFGGGVLVAAISLVLLPQGAAYVGSPFVSAGSFLLGGCIFFALDRLLARSRRTYPFLLATLLDYVPESLALGGAFAAGASGAPLLALLIGLQNLPEGFNAYRELREGKGAGSGRILLGLLLLVPIGPILAILGWTFLSPAQRLLGAIMMFAAGGILYLVFQDIAPKAKLEAHWFPPLGAVCGFALALLGQLLVGG